MILLSILFWYVGLLASLLLTGVGFIVIPIALWNRWTTFRESQTIPGRRIEVWSKRWMWLLGNEEDGLVAGWYIDAHSGWSRFKLRFAWSAWRNSCNNLQRVKYLNCPQLSKGRLLVKEGKLGCWCRYGPYSGGYLTFPFFKKRLTYGYGFIPWMVNGMPDNDTRDIPYIGQHWSGWTSIPFLVLTILIIVGVIRL